MLAQCLWIRLDDLVNLPSKLQDGSSSSKHHIHNCTQGQGARAVWVADVSSSASQGEKDLPQKLSQMYCVLLARNYWANSR